MKNSTAKRLWTTAFLAAAGAGLLSSCGHSDAEMAAAKADADALRQEAASERRNREEVEQNVNKYQREANRFKEQLEGVQKDREKAEDALKKLDKEFTDYKDKYKAAIRDKLPGLPIAPLVYDKKKYDNLQVRAIDNDLLTISNPNGLLHLKTSDLPEETQAFLALNQTTEYHSKVAALVKELDHNEQFRKGIVDVVKVQPKKTTPNGKPEPPTPRPTAFDMELMKFIVQVTSTADNGTTATGSGFLAKQGNATYFFTNAHLVAGATSVSTVTTDGRRFTLPDPLEMADEDEAFDLVRFKLGGTVPGLDLDDSGSVKVGDKVISMSDGSNGNPPVLEGKVQNVGPFWLDAESPTSRGTSGSPLLVDGETKVLGIVTHWVAPLGSHDMSAAASYAGARRVCLRPDRVNKWRPSSLSRLSHEPLMLDQIDADNNVLQSLLSVTFSDQGIQGTNEESLLAGGKSSFGPTIATSMRTVNAFFSRSNPTGTSKRGKQASIAGPAVREQCSVFVKAVLGIYGANVAGVDENSYSRFNRARFHQLAERRRSLCLQLAQHLNGEIAHVDPYGVK